MILPPPRLESSSPRRLKPALVAAVLLYSIPPFALSLVQVVSSINPLAHTVVHPCVPDPLPPRAWTVPRHDTIYRVGDPRVTQQLMPDYWQQCATADGNCSVIWRRCDRDCRQHCRHLAATGGNGSADCDTNDH